MNSAGLLDDLREQDAGIQERNVVGEREKAKLDASALLVCATALVEISDAVRKDDERIIEEGEDANAG